MSKKILIVEDEADIRNAIAEAITEAGFEVFIATNGAEGLEQAIANQPDLILLDLKMPVMDGQEALKRLRQDPWGRNAKVIALTSMDDAQSVAMAHTGDIEDYIIKVHNSLDDILRKVREAVYS